MSNRAFLRNDRRKLGEFDQIRAPSVSVRTEACGLNENDDAAECKNETSSNGSWMRSPFTSATPFASLIRARQSTKLCCIGATGLGSSTPAIVGTIKN